MGRVLADALAVGTLGTECALGGPAAARSAIAWLSHHRHVSKDYEGHCWQPLGNRNPVGTGRFRAHRQGSLPKDAWTVPCRPAPQPPPPTTRKHSVRISRTALPGSLFRAYPVSSQDYYM